MKRRFTEDSYRREPWMKALCQAFLSCKDETQLLDFLRDVATLSELQALSERFEVAKLVAQGASYREISAATGASTTTVTRVARFIENGPGGYRRILKTHRHHRMQPKVMQSQQHHQEAPVPREEKPVSVLQKYLEKAKQ